MDKTMTPLHGTKTHPLTAHALGVLAKIAQKPIPSQEVNPGVVNRLLREALVEAIRLPSPYASVKGNVTFLMITEVGQQALNLRKE